MKILAAILCFAITSCSRERGAYTAAKSRDQDGDGKIDQRIERTFRNGNCILLTTLSTDSSGNLVTRSRAYHVGGELVVIEADEDHDGTLETFVVFGPGANSIEAFTKKGEQPIPADLQVLEKYKNEIRMLRNLVDDMSSTNESPQRTILKR